MKTRTKKSKTCTVCGERKPLSAYQGHAKTADGLRHQCRDCQRVSNGYTSGTLRKGEPRKPRKRRQREVPTDAAVNGVLVRLTTALDTRMMPIVNQVVAMMRTTGCGRLTIDLANGFIEIPTPERFPLPTDGGAK